MNQHDSSTQRFKDWDAMQRLINNDSLFDPAAIEAITDRMIVQARQALPKVWRDPLYQHWIKAGPGHPVASVIDALGEQRGIAATLMAFPERVTFETFEMAMSDDDLAIPDRAVVFSVGTLIREAVPFLWLNDMRLAAQRSRVPPHVIDRDVLPLPLMYWSFETALDYGPVTGENLLIDAWVVMDAGDKIRVFGYGERDGNPIVGLTDFHYGKRFPDEEPNAAILLAMLSFLNSPYISNEQERMRRPERREYARLCPNDKEPSVRVVRLRAPEPSLRQESEQRNPASETNWHSRWLVRGHHRAQWYPSRKAHKVIWIPPYIKGPQDKPFKPPVYAVTR